MDNFEKSRTGKLLSNFSQELVRNIHFSRNLFAVDLQTKKVLWKHIEEEKIDGRAIASDLTENGFVLRYRTDETDDGLSGKEGTFLGFAHMNVFFAWVFGFTFSGLGLRIIRPRNVRYVPPPRLSELCGFSLSLRHRLKRSEPFAEPRLAEFPIHERSLHPYAALYVLEHQPVAVRANHYAKTAADVVHVVPAAQLGRPQSRPKLFPGPAREAVDSVVGFAIRSSLRDPLAVARPRPEGGQAELSLEGPGPGE